MSKNSNKSNNSDEFVNLFESQSNINLIYYIDYLTYKRNLIKYMSNDIELINNFFNDEISDILIKIFILKKKKIINTNNYKIFESIYDLINLLNSIEFFDQEDFLNVLLIMFNIKILIEKIIIFFNSFEFNDVINIKIFTDSYKELFDKICKNNIFLSLLFDSYIQSNPNNYKSNETIILEQIKKIAKNISYDFFMYYDSSVLYEKIITSLEYLNQIINLFNNSNIFIQPLSPSQSPYPLSPKRISTTISTPRNLINSNSSNSYNLYNLLKNNKNIFVEEYNYYFKKHSEIYSNYEFELKIKFKFKKKHNVIKLFNSLIMIKNIN